ncbi:MAG: aminoglycoside phosphotransferase family protein [Acidobacteria bacterium]|nr:aminoglycoside phosphotransferase family protein [Acidobacteriota bacterium]
MIQAALAAAGAFATPGRPVSAAPMGEGAGHIHRTFRVTCERGEVALQRLNTQVFPDLDAVMANLQAVTAHLQGKGVKTLELVPTNSGGFLHTDAEGVWRCTRFIAGGRMPLEPPSLHDARAAAKALGDFLAAMADFPVAGLRVPIPGFHDTRARFEAFRAVADGSEEAAFAFTHEFLADALVDRTQPIRPVHNDTKLANVLLEAETGEGLCVLDLDTVMPGLAAHDFGDLVRSAAFDGGEDEVTARLDLDRLRALAEGYLEGAGESVTRAEREAFGLGARVLAFELGLRFLTDHLEGDRYFAVSHPGQNLARARAQFARLRALETQADAVDRICAGG